MRKVLLGVLLLVVAASSLAYGAVDWEWFGTGIWYEITFEEPGFHEFVLDLPIEVVGRVSWVFFWHNLGAMGAFEKSMFSVWYAEKANGDWIGGPTAYIGGVGHSAGEGANGDNRSDIIHEGGQLEHGGYARLLDDGGSETLPRGQWSLEVFWPEEVELPESPRIVVIVQPGT